MPSLSSSPFDYQNAVARQFASRPTLRQVASQQLLNVLIEHLPWLASVEPQLSTADPLTLDSPDPSTGYWTTQPLLDAVLQAMLEGTPLDLERIDGRDHKLGLNAPYLFPGASSSLETRLLTGLTAPLNELIQQLPGYFCEAQVDYWRSAGSADVSRDRWLQLLIKMALLGNLPLHDLEPHERACVYGLLKGGDDQPTVYVVEAQLELHGERIRARQVKLLLSGEWDEGRAIVYCSPSSVVKPFGSMDDFAVTLRDELSTRYACDAMTWTIEALEGDAIAQLCALMLDDILTRTAQFRPGAMADMAEMEQWFNSVSDPAQWFIEGYFDPCAQSPAAPPGIQAAAAADSFGFQAALLKLTLDQLGSNGQGALDDVLDLHTYTQQQLREHMQGDHPGEAVSASDDLFLELAIARGVPGGAGAGPAGGETLEISFKTLTEFAIGNLSGLGGAAIKGIKLRDGQAAPDWITADYLKALITRVDIGARYPTYVSEMLDDPATRPQRVACFAKEWRNGLLFSALDAKLDGKLTDVGLQIATDFCNGQLDREDPAISLAPLAFRRQPLSTLRDTVSGMYVLLSDAPEGVLLYRPFYPSEPLREFVNVDAMMARIRQSSSLQASMLDWMKPEVRHIYANDGFTEPHITHLGSEPFDIPERPDPVDLAPQLWLTDVDARLYQANRDLLVELANLQSTSDAESRWQALKQGAWLLFDVVMLQLRGPVASVTWLLQLIGGLQQDLAAISQGGALARSQAAVDVLINLTMGLLHAGLPKLQTEAPAGDAPALGMKTGLPMEQRRPATIDLKPSNPDDVMTGQHLDFTWRGNAGLNQLEPSQRRALLRMRTSVDLEGLQPGTTGKAQGLYAGDGAYYVRMVGSTFRVLLGEQGVRILGNEGEVGPWLSFEHGVWRIDGSLHLRGGGPKTRREKQLEADAVELAQLREEEMQSTLRFNQAQGEFDKHRETLKKWMGELETLQNKHSLDDFERGQLEILPNLCKKARIAVVADMKALVASGFSHERMQVRMQRLAKDPSLLHALNLQRSSSTQNQVQMCEGYYNELAMLINGENLTELADKIDVRPETDSEKQLYSQYLEALKRGVDWGTDLVSLSRDFDVLLQEAMRNDDIVFRDAEGKKINKHTDLEAIFRQRNLNAIDQEVRLLKDLAELCIDRVSGASERDLETYSEYLVGDTITIAGRNHGELAGSEIPLQDRIELLTDIIEAYDGALVMAEYLTKFGGTAVRTNMLARYSKTLSDLKVAAERELAAGVREQDLEEKTLRAPRVYAARGGKRRVVRTRQGQSVLGEETEVDGVLVIQQRERTTNGVVKTYHQQGSEWVEQAPSQPPTPLTPNVNLRQVRREASTWLGEVEQVISLAEKYRFSREPHGLSTVIDGHVEKLQKALSKLPRNETPLVQDLEHAITRLQTVERDLLVSLYLVTSHPTAESLRFLFVNGEVTITRAGERRRLTAADHLDVYEVRRVAKAGQAQGPGLWEAHFHYPSESTPRRQFNKGHLKLWSQRRLGRKAQLRAAGTDKDLLAIYRGDLRLSQVEGVIPFD